MVDLNSEVSRRRTFAIISHPDAGKTTLTEKFLVFGGAIKMAGAVKARGEQRRAHSDWLKVERERGISVASSVMSYEYKGNAFNLLDTPGHEDFSEDTYRTLTAVDSAVMVIDAARGIQQDEVEGHAVPPGIDVEKICCKHLRVEPKPRQVVVNGVAAIRQIKSDQ